MKEKLDLRGLVCPEPVIATKKALERAETDLVEVLVDDEICVGNLERLARSQSASCAVEPRQGHFLVTISRSAAHRHGSGPSQHARPELSQQIDSKTGSRENTRVGTIVLIAREEFGGGDPDFSKTLANVFLQTLYEAGHRPRAILLANAGVKLMSAGSQARKVLEDFRASGCEVLCCGLCVEYYGLLPEINKEQITNMFAICEYLAVAEKVLQF
jgi:selenium metabolism protein YedF